MKGWTRRDLTIIPLGDKRLVISCDSCGGTGNKVGDILKVSPYYTAKFTARVALTEVICAGAVPFALANGVACEMNPTGAEMILGIKDELKAAGLNDTILTGSTEENFATSMTALAVTAIGAADKDSLKFGGASAGDKLILFGRPLLGSEIDLDGAGFYDEIKELLAMSGVREIIPVGSKGVEYEAEIAAALSRVGCKLYQTGVDYKKSAGPASCLLVICDEADAVNLTRLGAQVTVIGEFYREDCDLS